MNEHFLTYGAGNVALYGINGPLIMLISNSHECVLNNAQMAFIMLMQVHLTSNARMSTAQDEKRKNNFRYEYENILI